MRAVANPVSWRDVVGRDRRLTPARPDLAAAHLEGVVAADRFVVGERRIILADIADLRRQPRPDAPLETQALHGESVMLYDEEEGWGWVQLETDGYVGYLAMHALGNVGVTATHVVSVNRTFVYPAADMKRPVVMALPLGAQIVIDGVSGDFLRIPNLGFVFARHVAPVGMPAPDMVAVAEALLNTSYLWGGKSSLGVDCSGLVQVACAQAGLGVPRDTDMQEKTFGTPIVFGDTLDGLQRGDLVFWPGHVGIMRNAVTLLHANGHHMSVAAEPLQTAADRIAITVQTRISSIRRLPNP